MQWLFTTLGLFAARILSWIPLNGLFVLSDFSGFIFNRIFPYRKSVIDINLIHAFPHKKSEELWFIRSKYYRHLADIIFETIKSISIAKKNLSNHIQLHHESFSLLKKYEQSGQSIFVILGHYGNWEWASLRAGLATPMPSYAIYAPTHNKTFNQFLLKNRARFGCKLIAANQLKMLYGNLQKQPSLVAFVADQTPVDTENAYWTKFLHINTPFFKGYDALAKRTIAIVLYASIQKINRGGYEMHLKTITEHPQKESENYIVEQFARLLECDILAQPEYWLWSHRRWKRAGIKY